MSVKDPGRLAPDLEEWWINFICLVLVSCSVLLFDIARFPHHCPVALPCFSCLVVYCHTCVALSVRRTLQCVSVFTSVWFPSATVHLQCMCVHGYVCVCVWMCASQEKCLTQLQIQRTCKERPTCRKILQSAANKSIISWPPSSLNTMKQGLPELYNRKGRLFQDRNGL